MALPPASSPTISLALATPSELTAQQTANSTAWRGPLSLPTYLRREAHLFAQPLTASGGLTPWVLVHQPTPTAERTVLCGCESVRKRALVGYAGGRVEEVLCHGIASVFCEEKMRGRGYAGRMMEQVAKRLAGWQDDTGRVGFSVLYSDIGREFYKRRGWAPFASGHVMLSAAAEAEVGNVKTLDAADVEKLCVVDEELIRKRLGSVKKTTVAVVPDLPQITWHHAREEFLGEELLGRTPTVKGGMVGEVPGSRVWCYWTRVWTDPKDDEPNTLHILRLVVENESFLDFAAATPEGVAAAKNSAVMRAVASLLKAAQSEAAKWDMKEVVLWNPSSTTLAATQSVDGNAHAVEREEESIASLLWYGEGSGEDVDWICNEKYAWC